MRNVILNGFMLIFLIYKPNNQAKIIALWSCEELSQQSFYFTNEKSLSTERSLRNLYKQN